MYRCLRVHELTRSVEKRFIYERIKSYECVCMSADDKTGKTENETGEKRTKNGTQK